MMLQLKIPAQSEQKIRAMMKRVKAETMVDVFRYALATYDALTEAEAQGKEVRVHNTKRPDLDQTAGSELFRVADCTDGVLIER